MPVHRRGLVELILEVHDQRVADLGLDQRSGHLHDAVAVVIAEHRGDLLAAERDLAGRCDQSDLHNSRGVALIGRGLERGYQRWLARML
jgi:hypothetical protein